MTTIYINLIKGTIYTDSRCTTVQHSVLDRFKSKNKPKILGFKHSTKIFAMNGCGVVVSGDEVVSDHLKELFALGKNPAHFKIPKSLHNNRGCIHIVRPGYTVAVSVKEGGELSTQTYFDDNLTSGSGASKGFLKHAQGYLWCLTKEQIEKVLRLSSLFDVYSDDKIACMTYNDYRG